MCYLIMRPLVLHPSRTTAGNCSTTQSRRRVAARDESSCPKKAAVADFGLFIMGTPPTTATCDHSESWTRFQHVSTTWR